MSTQDRRAGVPGGGPTDEATALESRAARESADSVLAPTSPLPWGIEVDTCATCRDYGQEGEYQIVGPSGGPEAGHHAHFADRADAEYIVRACNSYPDLLAALKWAMRHLRGHVSFGPDGDAFNRVTNQELAGFVPKWNAAEAAIRKAEGQ